MRKRTFVEVLSLVALVGCDGGLAPEPAEIGSLLDPDGNAVSSFSSAAVLSSATGSGHVRRPDGTLRKFTISAVRHADGSTSGQYDLRIGPLQVLSDLGADPPLLAFHGSITCMSVVGNSAYLGGVVDTHKNGDLFFGRDDFTGVAIELIDNGHGNAPGGEPDQISAVFFYFPETPSTPQDYCDDPVPGPVFPVDQGNITVR